MNNIYDFIKINGNPFSTLELNPPTTDKKTIKSQYKELARKYHPDKNLNTKEHFIKIQKAYEFLLNNLSEFQKFIDHAHYKQQEQDKMSKEQKLFADDLKRRESMAEKQKEQEETLKKMRHQEELNRLQEQQQFEEKEKKSKQAQLIKFELENQGLYKKLNTIKVKWEEDQTYTEPLLRLLFQEYGAIQNIKVKKQKGSVTFHTTEAANAALEQSNDGLLKVRHQLKKEKREKVQEFLREGKQKLNRKNDEIYNLSTDTLNRISHFYNKDSLIEDVSDLKREEERLKLIKQIYEEELNK